MTDVPVASRESARQIFEAGLRASDPFVLLEQGLRASRDEGGFRFRDDLFLFPFPGAGGRLRVFGAGKAACSLARALEARLSEWGRWDVSGRILVKHGHGEALERLQVEEGGHPLPDEDGLRATDKMLSDLARGRPEDRIFFLLTGGASALLVAPAEGLSLGDKIRTTELLLRSGATIREMNAVRKHLSAVKGGRLLERMAPAAVLVFVVSDVIGDDLSAIGSGPLTADPTSFDDCLEIVRRYRLEAALPQPVLARLSAGSRGSVPETPKPGDPLFRSAHHVILANNEGSLRAARDAAAARGFDASIFGRNQEGDVHEVATAFARRLKELRGGSGRGRALVTGGELTLEVRGHGRGGRNQEFALVAARELAGVPGVILLSAGTDGTDGPTDAAGAYADGDTWARARAAGLDPERILADNDSYRLFDRLGDLLRTGPTGTNVNDLVVGLVEGSRVIAA